MSLEDGVCVSDDRVTAGKGAGFDSMMSLEEADEGSGVL